MSQRAFFFDASRCTGCKTCEFACKDAYDLDVGTAYRKVYEYTGGETVRLGDGFATTCFAYSVSVSCCHCENPACVRVCPTEAMHKEAESGLVLVDVRRCIGCGYCHLSCPYNAPKVDREKGHSVKCHGCRDRLDEGKKPVCVEACPARALDFGPFEAMEKLGRRADIAPLPEASATAPNLFVRPCSDARPSGSKDGRIVNPLEVL
ncbi:4Fe-4S dicluster domain-containing protein [Paraeggerthella sp. Marseille-Q4926]|jgi:anaerobic dimethyl sulfoxide reductase subunit B (iron-sulfur subunit)|uniref:4Fe-4S dicluster domain-containing protein n=1 Tax=Paraeggerthella sp. Marseille-Q4926 TaxID=2866587 RepID=UPI001CE41927|nr:4Fe-4S dicluster domain-containing protein [Paraeggerthella sp. Marseille-Q4926]